MAICPVRAHKAGTASLSCFSSTLRTFPYYGRTQVSDNARPAVLLIRSPRGSGNGTVATLPFRVSWALQTGTKTLDHPNGLSGTLSGGTPMINIPEVIPGEREDSVRVSMVSSSTIDRARLEKTARMTGIVWSENSPAARISSWSQRAGKRYCPYKCGARYRSRHYAETGVARAAERRMRQ